MKMKTRLLLGVGSLLGAIGAGVGGYMMYQEGERVKEKWAELTKPCSPEQEKVLRKVDGTIVKYQAEIKELYSILFEKNRGNKPGNTDIPERALRSYQNGQIKRYCASSKGVRMLGSSQKERLAGDMSFITKGPAITILPLAFEMAKDEGNVCAIVGADMHQRVIATTGLSDEPVTNAYLAGLAAEAVCRKLEEIRKEGNK